MKNENINPIISLDYPDPDVIRVGDTYYMVSTTMHFFPCCEILRSYDLLNWEHACFVCETLDNTPAQKLEGGNIYGMGMWAACLRHHAGKYYVCFSCNDTHKTYLYTSDDIYGKWEKSTIEGFYHDCSLLFDDDGRIYIVYGNKEIWLTELENDLSAPKKNGVHRRILFDKDNQVLGYEGSHIYKINGRYYVFFIHSRPDRWMRCEACFSSDSINGEFTGGDCLEDTMGYCGQGVAQGGIVDTPDGKWYAILFQDRGAVGRIPVLIPVSWENGRPVFGDKGRIPDKFEISSTRTGYNYAPLTSSDDFKGDAIMPCWQFNHEPDDKLCFFDRQKGFYRIISGKVVSDLLQAKNTLTQRMTFPRCTATVTIDTKGLSDGDFAGICALQGCYAWIGATVRDGNKYIEMNSMGKDGTVLKKSIPLNDRILTVGISADFENMKDEAVLFYIENGERKQLGEIHKLFFTLDHFTGCRVGLFMYSTESAGGYADFSDFRSFDK